MQEGVRKLSLEENGRKNEDNQEQSSNLDAINPQNPECRGENAVDHSGDQSEFAKNETENGNKANEPENPSMSHDEIAEQSLLVGLQLVKDKDLPIITSDFYSKFMVPNRPPGRLSWPLNPDF